ncbi:uncharacterized protein (TIGR02453 family) [Lewinella marina]|uniref:TIGR02453 family protein n=1 Tax=Neolewinella marina TaxID=438751 RepID=A0A2G0CGV0_9BACT|nr:DUF2461 domain-containing protein [Neolewinella marina]NJB86327.1 uncharacterized protein (TIGR02453 family) [Neolewinella marina]PHK99203.1 TIGR02453 family protein [Neolewinella marina]
MSVIHKSTYDFLRDLAANNDRDWFNAHKDRYTAARDNVADFAKALLQRLGHHDVISTESGRKSLFRIYRDVRFSKNKDPYKTNIAGSFTRDGRQRRGGYYFTFSPAHNLVGGGFYGIERDDLKRIREELGADAGAMRDIVNAPEFVRLFGTLRGEQLKTAPQGFPRDHPDIDLLRYKQFYAAREFTEAEVLAPDFLDRAEEVILGLRPFFDYFSEILTTDANGESIL